MKQIRKRLTYANVMSSIAVFLVLGGAAAFAAVQLPKNSVGTKQLKKKAVSTVKIKDNAVTGQKANEATFGQVPSAASAANATNASHADSATNATHAADATKAAGASAPETLASGKTLRGHYHLELNTGSGGGTNPDMGQGYSFIFPLTETPAGHFINDGETPPAECPGSVTEPQAAPGHLCVYEGPNNSTSNVSIGSESDQYGFGLLMFITGGGTFGWSIGSWAVTAP